MNSTSEPTMHIKSIGSGFTKAVIMVAGTTVAAAGGHSLGQVLGVSPPWVEGLVGGLMFATLAWLFFAKSGKEDYPRLQLPDTRVPDMIADNPRMTIVANPPNGTGIAVWDKEDGVALMEFVGEEVTEEIWLVEDGEIEDVINEMEAAR